MKNFIRNIVLALLLVFTFSTSVLADPLQDQLQKQQNQLNQDKSTLNNIKDKRAALEGSIEHLDDDIQKEMVLLQDNKNQISKKQQDVKNAEAEFNNVTAELNQEQDLFNNRLRAMYINGFDGYLEVILGSNGISDLMSRVDNVKRIIDYDVKIITDLNSKKNEVARKKEVLMDENNKLLALKADNEKILDKLTSNMNDEKKSVQELNSQEMLLASKIDESQASIAETLKQIEVIRTAAPKINPSGGAAPLSSNNVIAYASNYLGTPYLWGGTSPVTGFDCSGFTQYVYAHFGVQLGRTTYDQINDGYSVSKDQLQAGDLVFFGTWQDPHHMGIYVGNGSYIHAPHTGDVVKVSSIDRSDYLTARRVK